MRGDMLVTGVRNFADRNFGPVSSLAAQMSRHASKRTSLVCGVMNCSIQTRLIFWNGTRFFCFHFGLRTLDPDLVLTITCRLVRGPAAGLQNTFPCVTSWVEYNVFFSLSLCNDLSHHVLSANFFLFSFSIIGVSSASAPLGSERKLKMFYHLKFLDRHSWMSHKLSLI